MRCLRVLVFGLGLLLLPVHVQSRNLPVVKIGAVVAQTGFLADEGQQTREGYDLWRDWVNGHGGLRVGGHRYHVDLIYLDDHSDPNTTAQMTERLIDEEHVSALLGPYGSTETLASAVVAERRGVPMVAAAGSLEKIYDQGYRYTFGVMSPARKYLAGVIELATTLRPRPRKAAIVAASDGFSLEVQQGAIQLANDHGINVVVNDRYPVNAQNFQMIAQHIADAHVDLVLDAGHLNEAIALHRALADVNSRAKLYAYTVGPDIPIFTKILGPLADDAIGSAQWSESISDVGGPQFLRTARAYATTVRRRYHHQANYHNAAASAAGLALGTAMSNAHTLEAVKVRRALAVLDIPSFFGRIRFDARGINMVKPMVVNQIQNGRLVTIYPKRAAEAVVRYPFTPWQAR